MAALATKGERPASGSFIDVPQRYLASAPFKKLDASTQGWQKRALNAIAASDTGTAPLALMQPRHVRRLRDEKADTPAAANTMLKALRTLFQWALEEDIVEADPTRDVNRAQYVTKGHHTSTLDGVEQFERRHPLGSKPRLAFALLFYTACRREDATRLGPQHICDGRLRYVQAKNEHRKPRLVDVPVFPDLAEAIAGLPSAHLTFLVTDYGKPFSVAGFGNRFRAWCDQAGLPHCSAHGLRKATVARLAERGCTPHEIMAVTGHQTLEEVERDTREAQRPGLADSAWKRLPAGRRDPTAEAESDPTSGKPLAEMKKNAPVARQSEQKCEHLCH
ncbi:site-specific integrase [Methylobacterium sp. P1-11]|uniref:tyrosine-type recombinase/integrase n=1 Tax=Methylobacterium sp. P1-11 TaxID=2024616 RepID=UPI0011EC49AA|nr:site-specific integrase [Methylobacterium sp. P1-11]KAA0121872.1 site-specific integrase [Methylobacterium sp. P1-11]